jgi:acyl-coenzyme A thioesterase PaaI-like protein
LIPAERVFRGRRDLGPDQARRREAKHRLADAVRRIVEDAALVDATNAASPADLEALTTAAEQLADRFAAVPSHRERGGLNYDENEWEGGLLERSPISGHSNPLAAPLVVDEFDEAGVLHAHATYGYAYEGPPGHLHGGCVAGAFDEMVGVGQVPSGGMGYTGTLSVKFRRPTPLHTRVDYEAGVSNVNGRKTTVWSRSYANGELLCEAEALMISPRERLEY